MLYDELSEEIINLFFEVYNELGYGFLEKVYKNALYFEIKDAGHKCETEKAIEVFYKYRNVGQYYADIVVDDKIILELKVAESISQAHEYQLINYLRATRYEVGYVLNFGKKPEFKRILLTNDRKLKLKLI
jgi:GxxExxY protein